MKKVVVTGGCGFIGRNLIKELCRRGDQVRVLDNLSVGTKEELEEVGNVSDYAEWSNSNNSTQLSVGDIRNLEECQAALKGADAVVHLAAQCGVIPSIEDPVFDCETNVLSIVNLLKSNVD